MAPRIMEHYKGIFRKKKELNKPPLKTFKEKAETLARLKKK